MVTTPKDEGGVSATHLFESEEDKGKKEKGIRPLHLVLLCLAPEHFYQASFKKCDAGQPQSELPFLQPFNQLQELFCIFPARFLPV